MSSLAFAILGFVVAIGVLTTVHEFGHFWVARRLGVKVLRFSIGFGKPLITWFDKTGTEYAISSIPLGGYVKMLDRREVKVAQNELRFEFNNQPLWSRMLIIAAGPLFNIFFAVLAYWAMFMIGISSIVPVIGEVPSGSVAAIAGLRQGQEIIAIEDSPTQNWEDIAVSLVSAVGDKDFVNVATVNSANGKREDHSLNLANWDLDNGNENILISLGIGPIDPIQPIVGKVLPGLPAQEAGLESGDIITRLDGNKITSRSQLMLELHKIHNRSVHMTVQRNDEPIDILITPTTKVLDGGETVGQIGIQFENQPWPKELVRTQRYGPIEAFGKGLVRTWNYTVLTLQFLKKMLLGHMSLQHIAGPISIAKFAGETVISGVEYFLGFLALVSISLAVLNLLPIPILDGGHLLFCFLELIRGKPISDKAMQYGNFVGFMILGSFMLLALHNDFVRILQ